MGCDKNDEWDEGDDVTVEREAELAAPPDAVWEALPEIFEDDRARVDVDVEPGRRLTFFWEPSDDDAPPSYVEIELDAHGDGTLIRIRETRLDGAALSHGVINARAFA